MPPCCFHDPAGRHAGCGNGQCERGEACTDLHCTTGCLQDCPPYAAPCLLGPTSSSKAQVAVCSGHGTCVSASSECVCGPGYAGAACEVCALGFVSTDSGSECQCVFLAGFSMTCVDGVRNGNELGYVLL